jgi:hypothetical protein
VKSSSREKPFASQNSRTCPPSIHFFCPINSNHNCDDDRKTLSEIHSSERGEGEQEASRLSNVHLKDI